MSSGMRWALTTRASCGTSNSARICVACCRVSQSLDEPISTPTTGAALVTSGSREQETVIVEGDAAAMSYRLIVLPDDTAKPLVDALDGAKRFINIRMFLFTDPDMVAAVKAAEKRG